MSAAKDRIIKQQQETIRRQLIAINELKNQCDGCSRDLRKSNGIHVEETGENYMFCSSSRYKND